MFSCFLAHLVVLDGVVVGGGGSVVVVCGFGFGKRGENPKKKVQI